MEIIANLRGVGSFAVEMLSVLVKTSICLFFTAIFALGVSVIPLGGVVMILLSAVVFVVYALMMTLANLGIRIVDALKSL